VTETKPWDAFEERVARALGGELVPQSGGGRWAKLDVRGGALLVSCKWTARGSRSISSVEFDEAERAVRGPGGVKGDVLPALAVGLADDEPIVMMRASDFVELVLNREPMRVTMDRSESRRAHGTETPLMRQIRKEG
jgi:hypothetical protein